MSLDTTSKKTNKSFGVVVIETSGRRKEVYTDSTWDTIEEAEERRKFLESYLTGAKVEVTNWSGLKVSK